MTFKETPPANEKSDLAAFHEEIHRLKKEEEEKGKTVNFTEIDPDLLTETDLEVWNKFKDQTLTKEEFEAYRRGAAKNSFNFAAFIANKIFAWEMWPREKREKAE